MKAMIFCAGLGTRLKEYTANKPKALVELNGKPLLEHVILRLKDFGYNEILLNVHHFANKIIDFVVSNNYFDITIHFSDETEKLLDTGGGVKKAEWFFKDSPVLLHNVDILSNIDLKDLYLYHIKEKAAATLAVKSRETSRYLLFDNNNYLKGWKNEKTNEYKGVSSDFGLQKLAFSGIHIINQEIIIEEQNNGVFSIIDTYLKLCSNLKIKAYRHDDDLWFDLGKPEQLEKAENLLHKIND